MKYTDTYITLSQLKFYAYHGVLPQETLVGNTFTIDLKIKVDIINAIETDQLESTVNYAEIYNIVKTEMDIPSKLLEHVCGRILKSLFKNFPTIDEIEIKITKQNPPMGADIESAGIIINCAR